MALIQFDNELAEALEPFVPSELRGDKKITARAHYVVREWLRNKSECGQAIGGQMGVQPASGRVVSKPDQPTLVNRP